MNFNKFINSDYLKSNPLCGIDTYKDELNLATGACTRRIKKLVLTGEENFVNQTVPGTILVSLARPTGMPQYIGSIISSHFVKSAPASNVGEFYVGGSYINFNYDGINDVTTFETYLQQQYANGTPVTLWYALATPTTETITVPSGLSGTEEGYLIQDSTPTPTNPIYPTANTVEKWFDINHYIMGTDTDTLTTLPAVLYPNAVTATVGLQGNMEQSSQPSPTTPIQPSECGERTGNLVENRIITSYGGSIIGSDGAISPSGAYDTWYAKVTAGETYTMSRVNGVYAFYSAEPQNGSASIDGQRYYTDSDGTKTVTIPTEVTYVAMRTLYNGDTPMLNTGETALPYEPYGIKIPILSGGVTTPVYLGEVESTRRMKKLVLSSSQNWQLQSINSHGIANFYITVINDFLNNSSVISNYFERQTSTIADTTTEGMLIALATNASVYIRINSQTASTSQEFKNWLDGLSEEATIWYVLATETTGIVNEPIRKIGDYADEVSGITIPVTAGANTLSIGTTLQPSEVTVNYKGWHPVQSVHEKSKNLFDENYSDISGTIQYSPLYVGEGSFTLSTTTPYDSNVANVFLLSGNVSTGASTVGNGAWLNHNVTSQSVDGYVTIAYRHYTSTTSPVDCQTMLNSGSTPLPYEPYWN